MLENQTLKLTTAASCITFIVGLCWFAWSWAEDRHKQSETLAREAASLAKEVKASNDLLKLIQVQQSEVLKEAAKDAKTNRETLIRIETKLEK